MFFDSPLTILFSVEQTVPLCHPRLKLKVKFYEALKKANSKKKVHYRPIQHMYRYFLSHMYILVELYSVMSFLLYYVVVVLLEVVVISQWKPSSTARFYGNSLKHSVPDFPVMV